MRSALLLLCLVPGCSFPEPSVTDEPLTDTSIVVDSGTEATVDSAVEEASPADANDASTDSVVAADTKSDAPMEVNVCETSDPCDCDGDGDKAVRTGCSGGNDCDDGDPRRNSKVTSFLDYPVTGLSHAGDWDCVGGVTREYGNEAVNCGALALSGCGGKTGYAVANATCGTDVDFVRCKSNGITCSEESRTKLRVKCK